MEKRKRLNLKNKNILATDQNYDWSTTVHPIGVCGSAIRQSQLNLRDFSPKVIVNTQITDADVKIID